MAFSSDSESSDLSDLEILAELSDWSDEEKYIRRPKLRRVNYMENFDDADFTFRFRLSKTAVNALLIEITPFVRVKSSRNHGVSPLHQLLLALRFYALGTMLKSVAEFVGVSKSTASRIIQDISYAISSLYDTYISVHGESVQKFYAIAGFPRVLGCIDCTHVRIGSTLGVEFRNRQGYMSINVQGVCDADLKFMNVVAHWPGSTNDATIFDNSDLRAQCDEGTFENRWFLGDGAYPNRPYLLTPLLNPETAAEQRYNEAHIKTRNTIKRTIGIWKRRFPVLALTLRLSLQNVHAVIIATAVLHNICRNHSLVEIPAEVELPADVIGDEDNPFIGEQDIAQRDDLIYNFFT